MPNPSELERDDCHCATPGCQCDRMGLRDAVGPNYADAYQQWTRSTVVYPNEEAFGYLFKGLVCEVGVVAGKLKREIRDCVPPNAKEAMVAELGDVLWYLARMLDELGVPLSHCMSVNKAKLTKRLQAGTLHGSGDDR